MTAFASVSIDLATELTAVDGWSSQANTFTYRGTFHGHGADAARCECGVAAQVLRQRRESVSAKERTSLVGVTANADWGP